MNRHPVSGSLLPPEAKGLLDAFEKKTGLSGLDCEIRERTDGQVLVIFLSNPAERFFRILEEIQARASRENLFPIIATLKKSPKKNLLQSPESKLLLRTLSESLTITRHSFPDDFFGRYIKSVFGAEEQIVSAGNHVVFGRRGSGKSSLLHYAMHTRHAAGQPFAWIDMQVYGQRDDSGVVVEIIKEILDQAAGYIRDPAIEDVRHAIRQLALPGTNPTDSSIRSILPRLRRALASLPANYKDFVVFLDDLHVLSQSLQAKLLGHLYGISRGNRISLKASAIETFTKLWEPSSRTGLEIPHDVQLIRLDYNLTMTDKASEHIRSILDAHSVYCGLPSARAICSEADVFSRLVWVAAGVPRDALNVFSQAMTKASVKNQAEITITNINVAASEMVNDKLRYVELDTSGLFSSATDLLEKIKDFCIKREKKNAFLVEIQNDEPTFATIRQLIDLRLLHVIHEGITVREAGRKYIALILDYGFYTGIRAAKSVDLFNKRTAPPQYKELRSLPVFNA